MNIFWRRKRAPLNSAATDTTPETGAENTIDNTETNTTNMEDNEPDKAVRRRREKPWTNPLFYFAMALSTGSLFWTGYGIWDLLDKHTAGLAVALVADLIWAGVLVAEVQGVRIRGREWPVAAIGWIAVTLVVGLLVLHGFKLGNLGWIVAAPLVPYGAKVMWMFTLTAPYDPTAPTQSEQDAIDRMRREAAVKAEELKAQAEQHKAEMKKLKAENDKVIATIQAAAERARAMEVARLEFGMGGSVLPGQVVREGSGSPEVIRTTSEIPQLNPGSGEVRETLVPFGFSSTPVRREDKIEGIRTMIGLRGGDPSSVLLSEIEKLYGVSKATASQMRKEASSRD